MTETKTTPAKAWDDWPDTDIEAGHWVRSNGYFKGFDDKFWPNDTITKDHFVMVLVRAGFKVVQPENDEMTIANALVYLPGTVRSSKPTDKLTRYRLAVMLYRHFVAPLESASTPQEEEVVAKLEKLIEEKKVTWQGVTRTSRLIGYADVLVNLSREYKIPLWLAMGQCWRESQWFTTGLSIDYNCGWGLKEHNAKFGRPGKPSSIKGFANFATVGEAIHAYYRMMASPEKPYKELIDSGKIREALNIYAPASDGNNEVEHYDIVMTVKGWLEERGIK